MDYWLKDRDRQRVTLPLSCADEARERAQHCGHLRAEKPCGRPIEKERQAGGWRTWNDIRGRAALRQSV